MSHTPTPWKAEITGKGTGRQFSVTSESYLHVSNARSKGIICSTALCEFASPEEEANSLFIVKACNSHQALVDALDGLLRHCVTAKGFPEKGKGRTDEQQTAYDNARAILSSLSN